MKLREMRRNAEKSPKLNGHAAAVAYLKTLPRLDNVGVSMTRLPKLGINPGSSYKTPLGIYFYPADYYPSVLSRTPLDVLDPRPVLPFLHSEIYINVFTYDSANQLQVIDLGDEKIGDSILQHLSRDSRDGEALRWNGNPNELWRVIGEVSKTPVKWNATLRRLGYTSVLDTGYGIIHSSEPCQGLILDPRIILSNQRFLNAPHHTENQPRTSRNPPRDQTTILLSALRTLIAFDSSSPKYLDVFKKYAHKFKPGLEQEPTDELLELIFEVIEKNVHHATQIGLEQNLEHFAARDFGINWQQFSNYPFPYLKIAQSANSDSDSLDDINEYIKSSRVNLLSLYKGHLDRLPKLTDDDVQAIIAKIRINMGS